MFRLSALALLAASTAFAAPVPKEKGKELYFPVTVGAKWVMEAKVLDRVVERTETVTKVSEKGGVYTVTVDREWGGRTVSAVFEVSAKGVSRTSDGGAGGAEAAAAEPLLKLPAKKGDVWASERPGPGGPALKSTHVVGKEEEVEVPAGKYKAVPVVSEIGLAGGRTQKDTTWYAAGVGPVKYVTEFGGRETTYELKEFTPGKGEKKDEPKKVK